MIDYSKLYKRLADTALSSWLDSLPAQIEGVFSEIPHGELPRWIRVLEQLPKLTASRIDLSQDTVTAGNCSDCNAATRQQITRLLRELHPWRKGPYRLCNVCIDTEWRSQMKWNRLRQYISSLKDRLVLDVGCGNGYHCWRMAGAGAGLTIGIDPSLLYTMQFHAVKHFLGDWPVHVLPLGIEDLPSGLGAFDTVFSMGVLYHRRSPFDHLLELKDCLRNGGELVLETLVLEGTRPEVLVPEGRYAKMRNVWFIPTCPTLLSWLRRSGYRNPRLVDVTLTGNDEQRSTDWMRFHSLADFLDPKNPALTVEGMPAPRRAIFIAEKPPKCAKRHCRP